MKPSVVLSNPQEQCITFHWDWIPDYYIGYRFWEGLPKVTEKPIIGYETQLLGRVTAPPIVVENVITDQSSNQNWKSNWRNTYFEKGSSTTSQLSFRLSSKGIAQVEFIGENSQHHYDWYFQPFIHGVRIWAKLTTQTEIKGSFCVPQCLRFTGMYNAPWRQSIAHTPFLSEFDMQAMGNANATLTFARRNNEWFRFPVPHVVFPTCEDAIKVFNSQRELVDNGLIVRESPSRQEAPARYWELVAPNTSWDQITSGTCWERTACISNRHPADCVPSWIDFGPLAAGQSRILRGIVYFVEGTKNDLLALWRREFKKAAHASAKLR